MNDCQKEKIRSAIDQAVGNVQLENLDLKSEERKKIESILARYRHFKAAEVIDSLLYDLVQANELEKERNYGKKK